jgi:hypothetical protein
MMMEKILQEQNVELHQLSGSKYSILAGRKKNEKLKMQEF